MSSSWPVGSSRVEINGPRCILGYVNSPGAGSRHADKLKRQGPMVGETKRTGSTPDVAIYENSGRLPGGVVLEAVWQEISRRLYCGTGPPRWFFEKGD